MKLKLLGHSANDLFWFILPLVLPALLVRYDLNYTQAGGILTVYLAVTALGSFVLGRLSDRFSRRHILSSGFILAAAGLISAGFAANLVLFLVLISLTAVGVSTFHPVMYAVIDEVYPENKGRVMGIYECFGTGAILIMFLVNGFLLQKIGVRGVLVLTAVPALIMGFVYHFTSAIPASGPGQNQPVEDDPAARRKDISRFVLFLLSVILRVFSVTAVLNFLPTIFVSYFGYPASQASYATAFFFAGGIIGSLIFSRFSDRFNSFAILVAGTAFILPSILLLSAQLPFFVYPLIVTLFGCFASGCIINQNLLMTRLGRHLGKGEVFGILMGVMTITGAVSPVLFGFAIDRGGFSTAIMVFSAPLLFSLILLVYLLKTDTVKTY